MSADPVAAPVGAQQEQTAIDYPSQFLGEAANFITRGVGTLICGGAHLAVNQLSLAGYTEDINNVRTKYNFYEEKIFQGLFIIGSIYQARSALIAFVFGVTWGIVSGLNIPVFKISFLDRMPKNIWNKESGYLAQKIQGILFALNFIDLFKNPLLDNCIFGGVGGFIAGVHAHKWLKEYSKETFGTASKLVADFIKGSVETVNLQGIINLEMPKGSNQKAPASQDNHEEEQLAPAANVPLAPQDGDQENELEEPNPSAPSAIAVKGDKDAPSGVEGQPKK